MKLLGYSVGSKQDYCSVESTLKKLELNQSNGSFKFTLIISLTELSTSVPLNCYSADMARHKVGRSFE